eukprot:PITA_11776
MTGSVDNLIEEIKQQLSQKFEMKDLGEMHYFLGLEVWRDSSQTFLSQGYTDSDWVGNLDDRRSITGYTFSIGFGVMFWCSKKQHIVALYLAEAEYQALCAAACEVAWLYRLLQDVGEEQTEATVINCDNQSSNKLAYNPVFHKNTKHIYTQFHFLRERVQSKEICVEYCNSCDSMADIFTKPLG